MSDCTNIVNEQISYLEKKLTQGLTDISKQFSEQLKMIESKVMDAPVAMDQDILQSQPVTMDTASKIIIVDEYRDREMRKSNIIIYNIPESKSKDSAGQKRQHCSY